ncbi:MAG: proton-conducting transporter membrane subunit [Thermoplasmata archaeon]|nr:proton-conducting transporter membrane subunit [Thermoplasmata archaeon]
MISYFILASLAAIFLVSLPRSNLIMNVITQLHTLIIALLAGYLLYTDTATAYLWDSNLFIDSLSAYMIFISGIIFWLATVFAKGYNESLINTGELNPKNVRFFYIAFNGLLLSLILAFSSNNLALLWIFAELTTILSALLIVVLNAKENIIAAMKYIFITSIAMVFSFIGMILLFSLTKYGYGEATLRWDLLMQYAEDFPPELFIVSFVLLFIGFAAKSGLVPFHIWLPAAHSKAPSNVSAILSSSVISVGIYAIIRLFSLTRPNPETHDFASALLIAFGIITIGIAAFSMVTRTNLKKLIAFSSVEGMGLLVLAIGLGTETALFWALFLLGAHGLVKALMFLSAGIIHWQYHSDRADSIHSLFLLQPLAAVGLIMGGLAIIGTPFLPFFVPKIMILSQLGLRSIPLLFLVVLLFAIVASAFVIFLLRIISPGDDLPAKRKIPFSMRLPVVILFVIVLLLGLFFPDKISEIMQHMLEQLGWSM